MARPDVQVWRVWHTDWDQTMTLANSETEHTIQPGDWIAGPFWDGVVQVVALEPHAGYDVLTVVGAQQGAGRPCILTPDDWDRIRRVDRADYRGIDFGGDPTRFRLAIEAHRLRLAHAIDPYAALNASRIDPLPHQFEAVYQRLLTRPVVRALLAHDAGAGKTIMAGMVIKELQRRQGVKRILIVAPAGLTIQWQRELLTKFGDEFAIVDRDFVQQQRSDELRIWRETDHAIASIAFARQDRLRQALSTVDWDLVIVDEAHKMAAYVRPNGSTRKTQAYRLGEILSQYTTHFLLMTATPHKGDPDNYRLLVSLLGDQWGDAAAYTDGANPMVLRRTKEEMRRPNGEPLYPKRNVAPRYYTISHEEGDLLEQVQKFIRRHYSRAKSTNRMGASFALLTLERRMASSPYALLESLKRIREKLDDRLANRRMEQTAIEGAGDWADWEDLSEQERWEREAQAEAEAAAVVQWRELKAELRKVDRLIERASALVHQGGQEKRQSLQEACDLWVGDNGERLIVFTEFKDTLDYLVEQIEDWGYTTTQIHGGMGLKDRRAAERAFWDGEAQVLVATEAAGEGINLQCCSVMVNYDLPWNPCRLEQRMGRIHRYGQQADEVYVFNMIAPNTMEGQVKDALLKKMEAMRKDLGDKVFDVVGQVLWADDDLRDVLERIALGETGAVDEALEAIERGGEQAREAYAAESRVAGSGEPLDVAGFRRKQATFAAHRLSPEAAEAFFRRALPLAGGTLAPSLVPTKDGATRTAFDVVVPAELTAGRQRKLRISFWAAACSDDETEEDAVLFIAPGHWLFEALIDWVIAACAPDLDRGGVFCDLQPASDRPYLIWFARSQMRDGLDRHAGDLLAAVEHRADEEAVASRPSEILDGFEPGEAGEDDVRQVQPMLAAQDEVVDQCVRRRFLPALVEQREEKQEALARDRAFLSAGLKGLAEYLSEVAVDAFSEGDIERGSDLTDRAERARQRLGKLQAEMDRAGHLLMTAPEVLGVALVLPAPLEIEVETEEGVTRVLMRRDDAVEQAAMDAVMAYERRRGRFPKDVHKGESWDVESYDAQGELVRYVEVKGRGPEDADVVTMTEPEWEAARRLGEQHWLYIVRLGDGMLVMIQNPYVRLEPRTLIRWIVKIGDVTSQGETVRLEEDE